MSQVSDVIGQVSNVMSHDSDVSQQSSYVMVNGVAKYSSEVHALASHY